VKRGLMVVLGLLPENEGLSRKVQRIWFAAPVLLGWAFLLGAYTEAVLASWALLAILALLFFFDGLWGWVWAQSWLLALGGYYLFLCAGGWLLKYFPALFQWLGNTFLILFLLVFASPAIWPLCITGAAGEIGCGNPALLLPASLVWCLLALAWLLGKKLRSKTR